MQPDSFPSSLTQEVFLRLLLNVRFLPQSTLHTLGLQVVADNVIPSPWKLYLEITSKMCKCKYFLHTVCIFICMSILVQQGWGYVVCYLKCIVLCFFCRLPFMLLCEYISVVYVVPLY